MKTGGNIIDEEQFVTDKIKKLREESNRNYEKLLQIKKQEVIELNKKTGEKHTDEYGEEFIIEESYLDGIQICTEYTPIKKPVGYYQAHLTPQEQKIRAPEYLKDVKHFMKNVDNKPGIKKQPIDEFTKKQLKSVEIKVERPKKSETK